MKNIIIFCIILFLIKCGEKVEESIDQVDHKLVVVKDSGKSDIIVSEYFNEYERMRLELRRCINITQNLRKKLRECEDGK